MKEMDCVGYKSRTGNNFVSAVIKCLMSAYKMNTFSRPIQFIHAATRQNKRLFIQASEK